MNHDTSAMLARARDEYGIADLSNETFIITIKDRVLAFPPACEKAGYELRRSARADLRRIRGLIEVRRKELKAADLEHGRMVDNFARHWTTEIFAIEEPLRLENEAVDQAKEDEKKAREAKIRAQQEEEARYRIALEEQRLRAIREAEEARIKEEHAKRDAELLAERAKLREASNRLWKIEEEQAKARAKDSAIHKERMKEIERRTVEAEAKQQQARMIAEARLAQIEKQERAQKERIDRERGQLEAEQRRVKQEEEYRLAKIKAEQEAEEFRIQSAKEFQERSDREAAAYVQREEERLERAERLKPDLVKLREYAKLFASFAPPPAFKDPGTTLTANQAFGAVVDAGKRLEAFINTH